MEQSAYFGGGQVHGGNASVYLGRVFDPQRAYAARAFGENRMAFARAIPAYHRAPHHVNNSAYYPVARAYGENHQVSYPNAPRDNTSVYFHPVRPRENLQVSYPGASSGNDIHVSYPTASHADTSEYFQDLNMDGAPARPSGENLHVSYHSTSRGNEIHVSYPSAPHGNNSVYFPPARTDENPNASYPPYHGAPHHGTNGENFQNLNGDRAPARRGGNIHASYPSISYGLPASHYGASYYGGMPPGTIAYL
ncbi:unnamed protein product [Meloidogyne enterolobii]|uniref:Uncharacterized protein n=1 Tax=Meloidogyne enterolobii TaxID=390850 RepID=A0ACB1AHS1_MELEN